ncbi:MAG: MATE family efflux transporter, partial [Pseudomonadota bacterium]
MNGPRRESLSRLKAEGRATIRLAIPVMVSRVGVLTLIAVDSAMTGHAGAVELAYYAIAMAVQTPFMMFGIGLVTGTVILTAQAEGAGHREQGGAVLTAGGCLALVAGIVIAAGLIVGGDGLMRLLGQPAELLIGAGACLRAIAWGLIAVFIYAVATFFLEGIGRPVIGMVVMVIANVLNVGLNWILIYGNERPLPMLGVGWEPLGAEGAALATSIVRGFAALSLLLYIAWVVDRRVYGLGFVWRRSMIRRLMRLGLPVGISQTLESGAFAAMVVLAGWLGALHTAAFQIGLNLVSLPFMAALGLSTAASIRVGHAVGAGDAGAVRRAAMVAIALVIAIELVVASAFVSVPGLFAGLYSSDISVLSLAIPTVVLAGFVLVPDALPVVCIGALRGMSDVWVPTGLFLA